MRSHLTLEGSCTPRLRFFIILMVALAAGLFLEQYALKFTRNIELHLQDRFMRWHNRRQTAASDDIALIWVDEATVEKYEGAPPPRAVEAKLIDALRQSGALTIAMDFTFDMERAGTADLLAASMQTDGLVYGVVVDQGPQAAQEAPHYLPKLIPFQIKEKGRAPDAHYVLTQIPHEDLRSAITYVGHLMLDMSEDGNVRHVPLLFRSQGRYYPALSLIVVCLFKGVPLDGRGITVKWGQYLRLDNQKGWRREIPIDRAGRMRISYIGDTRRFRHGYSFWNLERQLETGIRLDLWKNSFSDKLVLIGNEKNLADWTKTPFTKHFPGVAIHGTAIDNMLRSQFVTETSPLLTICLALGWSGAMVGLQLWRFRPKRQRQPRDGRTRLIVGLLIFAVFSVSYVGLALVCGVWWGRFLAILPPLIALLIAWMVVAFYGDMEQLRREYVYRQTVIENIDNGLIVLSSLTDSAEINPRAAMMLGVVSSPVTLDVLEMQRPEFAGRLRHGLKNRQPDEFHLEQDGRHFQVNLVPFSDESEAHLIAVFTDVTRVKQLTAEIQRQHDTQEHDQVLKNLVTKLNHDIKNDLNGIIGFAAFLHRSSPPSSDIAGMTSRIITASRRITDVVNRVSQAIRTGDLKELSPTSDLSRQDLCSLVAEVIEEIRPRALVANIHIDWQPPENLPVLVCHKESLREAIRNVVVNALEAMPDGGRITIQIEATPTTVRLQIRDTGPGIPREIQDRVFEKFFTRKTGGNGMGLAQVKEAIERVHHGRVELLSGVGKGTSFVFVLPLSNPD